MAGFVRIILLLVEIAIQLEYVHSQNPMHSKVCFQPLGMESRRIPDSAITASSERIYYLRASKARLHMRAFYPWLPAGWSASVSDKKQWLEINLEMKTKVTGIGSQGLSSRWSPDQWVTSYQVSYKDDGDTEWVLYKQRGRVKTFLGNNNANDVVINQVEPSFEAVCVRLHPQTWHRWISMRVELFGCPASSCFLALGLEDRRIPDVAFSSSSVLTRAHAPSRARLHSQVRNLQAAGWAPIRGDKTPWLQVDLGTSIIIAGIGTQGGRYFWWSKGGWVEKFKVSFKSGEDEWQTYRKNTSEEELVGNSDINSLVINKLSQPFVARLVRIHPILRTICGYLRLEFYGCPDKNECASSPCQNNATCIDHVNSFSCVCPAGFSGVTCEIDKIECSSSPCKNNATCADHVNSFSCECPAGFTGVTCETEIDECSSSPCLNNGTCHDHLNGFSCLCHPGFTGRNCESDIKECSSSPCLNSGSCVDHVNKFSCVCSQGFTGLKCESVLKPTCSCGRRTTRRIVGGQRALPGEWPWQAGLMVKNTNQIYCGGALINQEWIVTGAHCVTYRNASTLLVVLGEYDVTRKEGIELFREVDTFYMHPDYHLLTADFDIALVRFKPALSRFSRFISPVCLPTPNDSFPPGTNCTVTGFGRLTEAGRLATTLQQAVVPIVSSDTCQAAYPDYSITPRMMCAGYVTGGIDACQGDSGGPMVCRKDNTHWYLAGVISWGLGCARPESYGIYANVTVLASWVQSALINSTICTPGL